MEENKRKKSTKYLLIGTLVLFLSVLGASVAYYLARVSGNLSGRAAGTELTINVQKISSNATGDLIPLDNDLETLNLAAAGYDDNGACVDINGYSVCQIYHITLTNNGSVPLDITGGVQLVGANTPNIDCAVMDNDTEVTSNNSCKGANTLADNDTLNAGASEDYYILVYINNLDEPQYDKGEFVGTVSFTSTQGKRVKGRFNDTYNAAAFIKDKFDSDESKTNVDAADGVQYKYATTEHLMYDRLGGTTTNLEEGNLRYYGASPNNYIDIGDSISAGYVTEKNWEKVGKFSFNNSDECTEYFNCKDNWQNLGATSEEKCNESFDSFLQFMGFESFEEICKEETKYVREPILWRIVGVFDGNLKIVREESIGSYSWDTSSRNPEDMVNVGNGVNEWSQADLMKLLNSGYGDEEIGGSLYWNSKSGTCYEGKGDVTTNCDFTTTGLSDEAKDLIVDNLWYLGGANGSAESQLFAKDYYALERGNKVYQIDSVPDSHDKVTRTTKWTGKVGLLYPSDYGYATDLNACSENLRNYGSSSCKGNDWMNIENYEKWTMTPKNSVGSSAFFIGGYVTETATSSAKTVHPVMYLKKDLVIESGTGTKEDPYIAG